MNRYAVLGVAGDVTAGRSVVVISASGPVSVNAFVAVLDTIPPEGVRFSATERRASLGAGGSVLCVSRRQLAYGRLRGLTVDVVVLDDIEAVDPDVHVLRAAGAEVIRA